MIPDEAVYSPVVQAIHALCHHMPMDHDCKACKFRAEAGVAYLVNQCHAAIKSLEEA